MEEIRCSYGTFHKLRTVLCMMTKWTVPITNVEVRTLATGSSGIYLEARSIFKVNLISST